jgi:hypothetical protein
MASSLIFESPPPPCPLRLPLKQFSMKSEFQSIDDILLHQVIFLLQLSWLCALLLFSCTSYPCSVLLCNFAPIDVATRLMCLFLSRRLSSPSIAIPCAIRLRKVMRCYEANGCGFNFSEAFVGCAFCIKIVHCRAFANI